MFARPIDIEAMFKEIEMINKKYGIPKGAGFVPDKLEIILERKEMDKFDLTYSEFFNYIPYPFLDIATENAIKILQLMGFPPEKIVRMENGVKVQISGDFGVAIFPIIEILLQNKGIESKINPIFDSIRETVQIYANLLDFYWNWDDETEKKIRNYFMTLYKVTQEHPSFSSEMEAVIKKYTVQ